MPIRNVAAAAAIIAAAASTATASAAWRHPARAPQPPTTRSTPRDSGYRVVPLSAVGRITGTVEFEGPAPTDSVTHPTLDADVCGTSLVDVSVVHAGARLAQAVVWVSGIATGKHLPVTRRFDVIAQGCRFIPRVQAAIAGGTLDVRSADRVVHHTRLTRAATGQMVALIPETEAGEVVPVHAALAVPGLLELRCDRHSWMHGWVAVFADPYYAVTDPLGTFVMDSVPPGRYAVTAWHERFGVRTDSVTVSAGQTAQVTLRYPLRSPAAAP
jgi:hypothetical protein